MRKPSPFVIFVASPLLDACPDCAVDADFPLDFIPVGVISSVALEQGAPMWVRG